MMNLILKPCPFCGNAVRIEGAYSYLRETVICCDGCDMEFTLDDCHASEEMVCDAWNRRTSAAIVQRGEWKNCCECSICGMAYGPRNENQKKYYRFCPNCGARMDIEVELEKAVKKHENAQ